MTKYCPQMHSHLLLVASLETNVRIPESLNHLFDLPPRLKNKLK